MKVVKPTPITAALLASSSAVETVAAWNAATAYTLGQQALRTATNRIYTRLVAGTTATAPEADAVNWLDAAPSNTWAMFDSQISTATAATSTLSVVIKPGFANSLALFGVEAQTLAVTVRDGLAGPVVYSATRNLDGTVIADWYQYFFEPAVQLGEVVLVDLPPYTNAHITITLTGSGTVKCGQCVVGTAYELGGMQYGASAGIVDYSRKDTDVFGVTTFTKRASSKRVSCKLMLANTQLNKVQRVLESLRATPCAWVGVGAPGYEPLTVYGFYKDFSLDVTYPAQSFCSLTLEGLT